MRDLHLAVFLVLICSFANPGAFAGDHEDGSSLILDSSGLRPETPEETKLRVEEGQRRKLEYDRLPGIEKALRCAQSIASFPDEVVDLPFPEKVVSVGHPRQSPVVYLENGRLFEITKYGIFGFDLDLKKLKVGQVLWVELSKPVKHQLGIFVESVKPFRARYENLDTYRASDKNLVYREPLKFIQSTKVSESDERIFLEQQKRYLHDKLEAIFKKADSLAETHYRELVAKRGKAGVVRSNALSNVYGTIDHYAQMCRGLLPETLLRKLKASADAHPYSI